MTQLEQRALNLLASACSKYLNGDQKEYINWEKRKYEIVKDYAIGLMTSQWFDGTEQQAIERGIEFADNLIERLKGEKEEKKTCCICGKEFYGWGNNPYPVVDDENARCCDVCNSKYVVPARLHAFFEHQKAKDNEKV